MSTHSFTKHPHPLQAAFHQQELGQGLVWLGAELKPPCASLTLARNSLLVFTGTLYIFRFSCLVFLANSYRVKLFNNIFGGMQAAGETQPKHFPCRRGFATSGQPKGKL